MVRGRWRHDGLNSIVRQAAGRGKQSAAHALYTSDTRQWHRVHQQRRASNSISLAAKRTRGGAAATVRAAACAPSGNGAALAAALQPCAVLRTPCEFLDSATSALLFDAERRATFTAAGAQMRAAIARNAAQAASSKQQAHRKSQDTHLLAGGRSSRQPHAGALSPWLPLGYHWGDVCEASALWKANAPCLIWSSTQVKNSCSKSSSKAPASRSD